MTDDPVRPSLYIASGARRAVAATVAALSRAHDAAGAVSGLPPWERIILSLVERAPAPPPTEPAG